MTIVVITVKCTDQQRGDAAEKGALGCHRRQFNTTHTLFPTSDRRSTVTGVMSRAHNDFKELHISVRSGNIFPRTKSFKDSSYHADNTKH